MYIQGFCQFRLSTADHALSLVTKLTAPTVLVITSRHGPHGKHRSSILAFVSVAAETFTELLLRNGRGGDHIENNPFPKVTIVSCVFVAAGT
jgi:hypothetical protein